MSTNMLFREDAYQRSAEARVVAVTDDGGVELDRTVFYATSGGQPGDSGVMVTTTGERIVVANAIHPGGDKSRVVHQIDPDGQWPDVGETVSLEIDWERRHKLMRMHTALHLITVLFPFPITGAQVGTEKSRVDFAMDEAPSDIAAIEAQLNAFIAADHPVTSEWIEEAALDANPGLVKSLNVAPPRGEGRIRLVRIGAAEQTIDLQPCGGTHVRSTGEIGPLAFGKIENKGRQNRRINVLFAG